MFIFQATVLKFCDLLEGWKLEKNAKMSAQYLKNYAR